MPKDYVHYQELQAKQGCDSQLVLHVSLPDLPTEILHV